jgi:hypothetical protein
MTDCELCKHNNDDDYCYDCEHNEIDFYDKYEPWTKEELEKIQQQRIERAIADMPTETIKIKNADKLIPAFSVAQKFTHSILDIPQFASVYFCDNSLIATDTHRLIVINQEIPEELNDRFVLSMKGDGETVLSVVEKLNVTPHVLRRREYIPLINHERKSIIATKKGILNMVAARDSNQTMVNCHFGEILLVLNKKYLDEVLDLFADDEELELKYADPMTSIVIKNDRILVLILPIRYV